METPLPPMTHPKEVYLGVPSPETAIGDCLSSGLPNTQDVFLNSISLLFVFLLERSNFFRSANVEMQTPVDREPPLHGGGTDQGLFQTAKRWSARRELPFRLRERGILRKC